MKYYSRCQHYMFGKSTDLVVEVYAKNTGNILLFYLCTVNSKGHVVSLMQQLDSSDMKKNTWEF